MASVYLGKARSVLLNDISTFLSFLRIHKALAIGAAIGLVVAVSYRNFLKDILVIAVLALIGIFSTYYKRFARVPPSIELITFGTVIVGLAYGPIVGAIFGAIVTIVAEVFNSGIDFFIVGYVPARAAVGFASSFFPAANIVLLGTSMSVLYNLVAQPLYAFQSDAELRFKLVAFIVTNISFNFLAFTLLGNFVKGIAV
ncbi:hypothetical protein HYU18_04795 [Candidatus Woesearchaeota archaeon]|nr:hypothetical protein [Candidatus Woesearchaeota archaeon]